MNELFRKFAQKSSAVVGSAWSFVIALLIVIMWAVSGPFFNFSDTWQLVINTATTISTGLIVFLVQNTQNRDGKAIQLKLDELIRAQKGARTELVDLENLSDEQLAALDNYFSQLHKKEVQKKLDRLTAMYAQVKAVRRRRS